MSWQEKHDQIFINYWFSFIFSANILSMLWNHFFFLLPSWRCFWKLSNSRQWTGWFSLRLHICFTLQRWWHGKRSMIKYSSIIDLILFQIQSANILSIVMDYVILSPQNLRYFFEGCQILGSVQLTSVHIFLLQCSQVTQVEAWRIPRCHGKRSMTKYSLIIDSLSYITNLYNYPSIIMISWLSCPLIKMHRHCKIWTAVVLSPHRDA